jgi:hypothetical protein
MRIIEVLQGLVESLNGLPLWPSARKAWESLEEDFISKNSKSTANMAQDMDKRAI